jgi:hypothetical protein
MATYQHVHSAVQADAARVFAGLTGPTGFDLVEGFGRSPLSAEKYGKYIL